VGGGTTLTRESGGVFLTFSAGDLQLHRDTIKRRVEMKVFKTKYFSDEIGYPVKLSEIVIQKQIQF
jgi:hypothetical protein